MVRLFNTSNQLEMPVVKTNKTPTTSLALFLLLTGNNVSLLDHASKLKQMPAEVRVRNHASYLWPEVNIVLKNWDMQKFQQSTFSSKLSFFQVLMIPSIFIGILKIRTTVGYGGTIATHKCH